MRQLHDRFFRQAKREGHLARSYYKLEELQRRNQLIKPGNRVIDLGAAPGGWLEVIVPLVGARGVVCAVDLQIIAKQFKGKVHFKKMSVFELDALSFVEVAPRFDVVVSDTAPSTSGIKLVDQARSLELADAAWVYAQQVLEEGGRFCAKVFESPELQPWRKRLQPYFASIRTQKPAASRDESYETYVIGIGFRRPSDPPASPSLPEATPSP